MISKTTMRNPTAFILLAASLFTGCISLANAIDPEISDMEDMLSVVDGLKDTVKNLARQVRTQQLFIEEKVRSDGNSGIKQVRTYLHGTEAYFTGTHIDRAVAAIHDHSNYKDTIGMGETIVVLNGVDFRTRHNDYKLVRPSTTSKEWRATEPVKFPEIPKEVLNAGSISQQIAEMREWFRAFKEQDYSVRDYRKYFKPVLCYLEGAWTIVNEQMEEPFKSDRHFLDADTWEEAEQQIRYTSATGSKDLLENFSFLPTKIVGFNETTDEPIYGQWNYRIMCHPYSKDIPLKYFRQQDDLSYREKYGYDLKRVEERTRGARYRLSKHDVETFTEFDVIDSVMQEIPGPDNIPDFLNEAPIHQDIYNREFNNQTFLNTGYYHRFFKAAKAGAMGRKEIIRGFSDEFLYVAETTQERVASVDLEYCKSKGDCSTQSTRFSYAIPMEVIYLTPLLSWNPYNLTLWDNFRITTRNGRRGHPTNPRLAYNGTSELQVYYLTPSDFFKTTKVSDADAADTVRGKVGVLGADGKIYHTAAAGTRVILPDIEGVGIIRLRYPIHPVHVEGSTTWKELNVLKKRLQHTSGAISENFYYMKLSPTTVNGEHDHEFFLSLESFGVLKSGGTVSVSTSESNGHSHNLRLKLGRRSRVFYIECDNEPICSDQHPPQIQVISGPDVRK